MVCGGTSIVVMYNIIQDIAHNLNDKTQVSLIAANSNKDVIFLKENIESCMKLKSG